MNQGTGTNTLLLLRQLKQGSEPAFNALYNLHSKMLLSNIRSLVKNNETAKELLQDLYLKIWENRAAINPEQSFKSYLFTIARNMVYDYFRRASIDKKAKATLMIHAIDSYTHTEEGIAFKESSKMIKAAIDILPPQRRLVYTLSKGEGKSHQEISGLLNISISTVNNHMVKANKEIQKFLHRHGDLSVLIIAAMIIR